MKEENKQSVEERLDFLESVLNKIAEEQVFIEDALKLMKKKIPFLPMRKNGRRKKIRLLTGY